MIPVLLMLLALPALAGEYAVLASGFRIHADRHETEGPTVRLFSNGGMTEVPAAEVSRFEVEEYTPPAPKPAPAAVAQPNTRELITSAAKTHGLPSAFVHSVVAAESGYRPNALSPKGAIGLMQLMPGTARALGADPAIPEQNVNAGARYLRELLIRYNSDSVRALAAYNAGPGVVDRYHGVPPYRETRAYITRVLRQYERLNKE